MQQRTPWLKNWLIKRFCRYYSVDLSEAQETDINAYPNFNAFFTRALKAEARHIDNEPLSITSPADGCLVQFGAIERGRCIQAKGQTFTVRDLLGAEWLEWRDFKQGQFATIYLSPKDYHRVHMPMTGKLRAMAHIPGYLFSVNPMTTAHIPELFANNERVACLFDTEHGPMAIIMVGAMLVASIHTTWHGQVSPPTRLETQQWQYDSSKTYQKGEEIGHFAFGSTVIVLLPNKTATTWQQDLLPGQIVQMGQPLATCR